MALESWPLLGESGFPLNAFYGKCHRKNKGNKTAIDLFSGKSKGSETGELKNYLTQVLNVDLQLTIFF